MHQKHTWYGAIRSTSRISILAGFWLKPFSLYLSSISIFQLPLAWNLNTNQITVTFEMVAWVSMWSFMFKTCSYLFRANTHFLHQARSYSCTVFHILFNPEPLRCNVWRSVIFSQLWYYVVNGQKCLWCTSPHDLYYWRIATTQWQSWVKTNAEWLINNYADGKPWQDCGNAELQKSGLWLSSDWKNFI